MEILLVCACGSSTTILMQSMYDHLREDEKDWKVTALSVSEAKTKFGKYEYILLAPQVKYQTSLVKELCKDIPGITILNISAIDFGRCNGNAVLNMIREAQTKK
ncbi:MAG: PTS sugar transporter subunit IIB [Erysipelotrichaceae bacterium]|nr:PTS sugar transporter subunit IIB [Erysipelotrichaceae bacterium]